jgi:hypothetical protein
MLRLVINIEHLRCRPYNDSESKISRLENRLFWVKEREFKYSEE